MVPVICGFLDTARQEAPGKAAVQEESQNRTYEAWLDIRYQCLKPGLCRFHRFNMAILHIYIYIQRLPLLGIEQLVDPKKAPILDVSLGGHRQDRHRQSRASHGGQIEDEKVVALSQGWAEQALPR